VISIGRQNRRWKVSYFTLLRRELIAPRSGHLELPQVADRLERRLPALGGNREHGIDDLGHEQNRLGVTVVAELQQRVFVEPATLLVATVKRLGDPVEAFLECFDLQGDFAGQSLFEPPR